MTSARGASSAEPGGNVEASSPAATAEDDWSAWIGRVEEVAEEISPWRAQALAASLDIDATPTAGALLPSGWHWLYFNPIALRRSLGPDGHPKRGGFLPPVALPRRMWAGGRLKYLSPITIGDVAIRRSEIARIESKTGKRGSLVFVTVRHRVFSGGTERLVEEQDIVYREATSPGAEPPPAERAPDGAEFHREVRPDSTLLFRYSALTFNGHRIHYDRPYAQNEERYPDLVVQGPLTATLLQDFAVSECRPGGRLSAFEFRGVAPLFVDRPFWLEGTVTEDGGLALWARTPDGALAMSAKAQVL
jgi:3-methylfumaryl-CoA hydratase